MVLFVVTLLVWAVALFSLRPAPADLRAQMPSRWQSFTQIQATFWLGVVLILAFYFVSNEWLARLSISNADMLSPTWFVQTLTHNFLHLNLVHLSSNLVALGWLSLYERRVGPRRFLFIFVVGGMLSAVSLFLEPSLVIAAGASSGLYALAAAYFVDRPDQTMKNYLIGAVVLAAAFVCFSILEQWDGRTSTFEVDTWGHLAGLICGLIICAVFPNRQTSAAHSN